MQEERSKRIKLYDDDKFEKVNQTNLMLFKKYQVDMSIRELSVNTIKQYNADIKQWFIYILENQFNQSILDLTEDDISEYLYWRKQQGNHTERMKRQMATISALYKFLRKKKLIKENPMEFLDRPKRGLPITVQTYLTEEQVNLMREKLKENGDLQLELYALFSLSTMARVNAVSNLKWKQIDYENRKCFDVLEKEGKIVDLFFSDEVKQLLLQLKKYREENNIADYGYVFKTPYTSENKPISNTTLDKWCKQIGAMIGVKTLHAHDFRHSGATLLKNRGLSLESVSVLLHHESTDVTKKFYIKEDSSKISSEKDKYEI